MLYYTILYYIILYYIVLTLYLCGLEFSVPILSDLDSFLSLCKRPRIIRRITIMIAIMIL